MIVDGWKSRSESTKLGTEHALALRDSLHRGSAGGSGSTSSEKSNTIALEGNGQYEASFKDD